MTDSLPLIASHPDAALLPPVIQVEGAAITLGGRAIWQEVALTVQPGEFLDILGPNGAGKSTLLKAILGLLPLSTGTISVLGKSARRGTAASRYVPQLPHFDADGHVRRRSIV